MLIYLNLVKAPAEGRVSRPVLTTCYGVVSESPEFNSSAALANSEPFWLLSAGIFKHITILWLHCLPLASSGWIIVNDLLWICYGYLGINSQSWVELDSEKVITFLSQYWTTRCQVQHRLLITQLHLRNQVKVGELSRVSCNKSCDHCA